jgi:PhoPQ-activated pathogenicity-related protein
VSGSGTLADEEHEVMEVSSQYGVSGVVLSDIPNQPTFGNRKEDNLLAFTFHRFFENGDPTIPALLPMRKAVSRAMDCISMIIPATDNSKRKFIVSGASKRGWTTWLVGLNDTRVVAIAPRVFEMINISAQLKWAKEKNGSQSDKLRPYTEFGLTERIDEPRGRELLKLIDPFESISQRELIVLSAIGANDPYWLIDSSQHYWDKVLGQKAMIVVPNVGHKLGKDKVFKNSLMAWIGKVLRNEAIPTMSLTNQMGTDMVSCTVSSEQPQKMSLWYADSADYDFRDAIWLEQPMTRNTKDNRNDEWCGKLPPRCFKRYCAYFTMADLQGGSFPISTPPKVFIPN